MSAETYFSVPGVATVRWDEPSATVVVEWDGWANTAEFAALLAAEVKALKEHGGSRLLADCRRQRVLNPADQERADRSRRKRSSGVGLSVLATAHPRPSASPARHR